MNSGSIYLAQNSWRSGCVTEVDGEVIPTIQGFECLFAQILNTILSFAGIALLVMLVIGGFKLMTAGGDPKKTQSASQTLTYAVIGLVAMVGVYLILLLLSKFLGINLLIFQISSNAPSPGP